MILCILILCTVVVSKGELTQKERDKTLCYHNTLRQITSNCIYPMRRKKWNKTLEYFAHVYSKPIHVDKLRIIKMSDFCEKANIIPIYYDVDQYEEIYEQLSNVTQYFDVSSESDLPEYFYRMVNQK
ncbi:hypothetical protein EG68_04287 [Paragonimus skrjabini miyazakii]|uniref:SCP domain-containing protein n=1 Tax=Paragonimus skrjabini miyazakii TaxID=59628 RepID=A0A8S9YYK5_9TREM|nr:hypothetical protein EG68_04287 [Paragonimus skrjabini miyazakii]